MFQQRRATTTRWQLSPPDYREQRGDKVLLIWGAIPYWMVVDGENEAFLRAFDGAHTLNELLRATPAWQGYRTALVAQVQALSQAGVLVDRHPKSPPPQSPPQIENVALNLTLRCNLRCRFCFNLPVLQTDDAQEITTTEVGEFLDSLQPFIGKQPTLTILGGEPLLAQERLIAVTQDAQRRGYVTLVSTNGTLITEDFARQAQAVGLRVQVSLDGPTAAVHETVRGSGTFARTLAGIQMLVRQQVPTTISMVCHLDNLSTLEDFLQLALTLGVPEARFIPLKRLGGAVTNGMEPVPLPELLQTAYALLQRRPEFLPLLQSDAFTILANTCAFAQRRRSCGTGLQTVMLDADGALYPCANTNLPRFRLGNIRDPHGDFAQLWQRSPLLQHVRAATDITRDSPHSGCPVRYWCLGGCRGENLALTDRLDARPPHCNELRCGIIALLWMLAERPDLARSVTRQC